jgi:hypothetical protein
MKITQPTMNLRFVEREILRTVSVEHGGTLSERVKVKILQQQFASLLTPNTFEWRDVPLEVEQ